LGEWHRQPRDPSDEWLDATRGIWLGSCEWARRQQRERRSRARREAAAPHRLKSQPPRWRAERGIRVRCVRSFSMPPSRAPTRRAALILIREDSISIVPIGVGSCAICASAAAKPLPLASRRAFGNPLVEFAAGVFRGQTLVDAPTLRYPATEGRMMAHALPELTVGGELTSLICRVEESRFETISGCTPPTP